MAIVGIILAILVGIGFMLGTMQLFGGASSYFGEAFILFVQKLFLLFAVALPMIIAVVIFYIAVQKEKTEIMVFGAIYAMMLYLLVIYTGLFDYVSNLFYTSMLGFNASWYDALKPVKDALVAVGFFVIGIFNNFVENVKKFVGNVKSALNLAKKKKRR